MNQKSLSCCRVEIERTGITIPENILAQLDPTHPDIVYSDGGGGWYYVATFVTVLVGLEICLYYLLYELTRVKVENFKILVD